SLLANIALNPIAYNIDEKTEKEIYVKEMMLEGIISIQSGESSIVVEERLATYLSNNEKLEIMKSNKNTERAMSNGA
ncbi:motility protein A, partial [Clostridioides difficile]|nr:motility protein A [Clostridioides difficile]MDV9542579.1 motility protein A [Clostridioides difficile]